MILRPKETARYLGIHLSTVYRWERDGLLPHRVQLGPLATGWRKEDLDEWLANRPNARGTPHERSTR